MKPQNSYCEHALVSLLLGPVATLILVFVGRGMRQG